MEYKQIDNIYKCNNCNYARSKKFLVESHIRAKRACYFDRNRHPVDVTHMLTQKLFMLSKKKYNILSHIEHVAKLADKTEDIYIKRVLTEMLNSIISVMHTNDTKLINKILDNIHNIPSKDTA